MKIVEMGSEEYIFYPRPSASMKGALAVSIFPNR